MSTTLPRAGAVPIPAVNRGRRRARPRRRRSGHWAAFTGLAAYGTLRWSTMLGDHGMGRLWASLVIVLALTAARRRPLTIHRGLAAGLTVLAALVLVALAGFPLNWHLGLVGSALGDGLGSLPGVLVPYNGGDPHTTAALVLTASILLLLGGLMYAASDRPPVTLRLAISAIPLVALAVVPSVIVTPQVVYLHGLLTAGFVVALVLGPRIPAGQLAAAGALLGVAALLATLACGLVAGDRRWFRVATGHAGLGTGPAAGSGLAEQFDWQQTYGTQGWPYTGETVATIHASRPAYWKAEDLDVFNGSAWTSNDGSSDDGLQGVDPADIAQYSETLSVHLHQIFTDQVIAAGYADQPGVFGSAPGFDPGTWVTNPPLQPGQAYRVRVYVPDPSAEELSDAGDDYPAAIGPFLRLDAPARTYAPVRALARRLAADARTPYDVVESVLDYLQRGYVYTLDPPSGGTDPLVDFLLHSRRGYCQQFAGAMALMLRMDGVPARVAVGFSPGQTRQGTHDYVVDDEDAHAWVEVWFPGYGWVTFDPTPGRASTAGATPAAAATRAGVTPTGTTPLSSVSTPHTTTTSRAATGSNRLESTQPGRTSTSTDRRRRAGGDTGSVIAGALVGLLLLGGAATGIRSLRRRSGPAELTDELVRAFTICGRPLTADVTLTGLAHRLAEYPAAAAYVRALATARYGRDGGDGPTASGRAALRSWLGQDLGVRGRLRALRALPPRRARQLRRASLD